MVHRLPKAVPAVLGGFAVGLSLIACNPEEEAEEDLDAAIEDLDPAVFTDPEGFPSRTGDGPFPSPDVTGFEVTLVEGADLEQAGAQLNMLREDHGISPTVHLDGGRELRVGDRPAPELTEEQWAQVLELVEDAHLTSASVYAVDEHSADGESREEEMTAGLALSAEVDTFEEAQQAMLSWQDLAAPEGITAFSGSVEAAGQGSDQRFEVPRIQLSAPIGEGQHAVEIVEDAAEPPGLGELYDLNLQLGGEEPELTVDVVLFSEESLTGQEVREKLVEEPEYFDTAEDFADQMLEALGDDVDLLISTEGEIRLAERGRFVDSEGRTPAELNEEVKENLEEALQDAE